MFKQVFHFSSSIHKYSDHEPPKMHTPSQPNVCLLSVFNCKAAHTACYGTIDHILIMKFNY